MTVPYVRMMRANTTRIKAEMMTPSLAFGSDLLMPNSAALTPYLRNAKQKIQDATPKGGRAGSERKERQEGKRTGAGWRRGRGGGSGGEGAKLSTSFLEALDNSKGRFFVRILLSTGARLPTQVCVHMYAIKLQHLVCILSPALRFMHIGPASVMTGCVPG